jgi:hypothetical protein
MTQRSCPAAGAVHALYAALVQSTYVNVEASANGRDVFHIIRLVRHDRTSPAGKQDIGHIIDGHVVSDIVDQRYSFSYILNTITQHFYLLKEKSRYANRSYLPEILHIKSSSIFPYVGIIQIRLWVRDIPPVLSLPAQAPLKLSTQYHN